jgi:hypothetical protein
MLMATGAWSTSALLLLLLRRSWLNKEAPSANS